MEDKIIQIDKQTGQPKKEKVISVDDLSQSKEFSKKEIVGVINLSLNQFIHDRISLEISLRSLRFVFDKLRGREKTEEVSGKIAEVLKKIEAVELQIRLHRQVRSEIEDGRFEV